MSHALRQNVLCFMKQEAAARKIHRKTPVPESFFPKEKTSNVQKRSVKKVFLKGFKPATLLKKKLWHWCFPVNFVKFLRTPFLQNTFGRWTDSLLEVVIFLSHKQFFFSGEKVVDYPAQKLFCMIIRHRSSLQVFRKKGVLKDLAKFTGKHLYQILSFNKVAGLSLQLYLKNRLWHWCFPVNFAKSLRTPFLIENLQPNQYFYPFLHGEVASN